jgi:Domain of unknown function (DUF5753)
MARGTCRSTAAFPDQPDEAQRRVQLRMARQACLTEDPPLQCWGIVDEAVLHRRTDGEQVMHAQLRHLITMSKRDDDLRRITLTYTHLQTAALSVSKSRDLIAATARELA